jgi:4-amino-4-deoxychorismate lyase
MSLFIESIKVLNGKFYNLDFHQDRINRTLNQFYPNHQIDLNIFNVPQIFSNGLFKFRLLYSNKIEKYEYLSYRLKEIKSLKIVNSDNLNYEFKYQERTAIHRLFAQRCDCDDILIVRNNLITDTSYCNILLEKDNKLFTPSNPLLKGTQRDFLLSQGLIEEREIRISEINYYKALYLINCMIDFTDKIKIEIGDIKY